MKITPYEIAQRFAGIQEVAGSTANPAILAMLRLDAEWPEDDSVPWCSAFMNYVFWLLNLPRSRSLRARSWLNVGFAVGSLWLAERGHDVVVLKRGGGDQPGPEVIKAPGHVGLFHSYDDDNGVVKILGGNQSDSVNVKSYSIDRILSIQRVLPVGGG